RKARSTCAAPGTTICARPRFRGQYHPTIDARTARIHDRGHRETVRLPITINVAGNRLLLGRLRLRRRWCGRCGVARSEPTEGVSRGDRGRERGAGETGAATTRSVLTELLEKPAVGREGARLRGADASLAVRRLNCA